MQIDIQYVWDGDWYHTITYHSSHPPSGGVWYGANYHQWVPTYIRLYVAQALLELCHSSEIATPV